MLQIIANFFGIDAQIYAAVGGGDCGFAGELQLSGLGSLLLLEGLESCDEVVPDLEALRFFEILVAESELNAGFEGFVEEADAIAG
jgi:hypothetical protein